ncbi:TPA: DUF551 domain-containing protein [Escherichia coli]
MPAEEAEELARIALASLEEEPVAWLHSENGLGIPAITRSKNIADSWLSKGWYVQPLYIAKPVPVVPDARPSLNNGIVGFDEGWNACRAAMLNGAEPVSQTYKLNELSGNSPVTPDSWISRFEEMPDPSSEKRVCAFTPTNHEDMRYRFVPASLFKTVCRDATHWFYMLPPVGREEVAGG